MIDFIKKNSKISDLYISKDVLLKIIKDFKNELLENKETLLNMYEIDKGKTNNFTSIETIIEIIDSYKNKEITKDKKEIIVASYYGNPYITVNLCMQSLTKKKCSLLIIEDNMLALNKLIIAIFNNILKNYKIFNLVTLYNSVKLEEIKKIENMVSYIVCIGNSNTYYKYCKKEIKNVNYIPFKNLAIYCDNKKFEELKYKLYSYAIKNSIEVEIYDDIDEFIECVNLDKTLENVLILTEKDEEILKAENRIKKYKLYINDNPFKNEKFLIKNSWYFKMINIQYI